MNKATLRQHLRRLRAGFSPVKRTLAARNLSLQLRACGFFMRRTKLAFYLATGGEIDTSPAIKLARKAGAQLYLPRIENNNTLSFHRFGLLHPLKKNRYGIHEVQSSRIPLHKLDVIFMPLVAFDRTGNRLGMGGGYYDRSLAGLAHRAKRPLFVGLGYSAQEVSQLPDDVWDVQLDCVVTENEVLIF